MDRDQFASFFKRAWNYATDPEQEQSVEYGKSLFHYLAMWEPLSKRAHDLAELVKESVQSRTCNDGSLEELCWQLSQEGR